MNKNDESGFLKKQKNEPKKVSPPSLSQSVPMVPYVPKASFPQCLNMPSPFSKKDTKMEEIGRASCRERVCQYV